MPVRSELELEVAPVLAEHEQLGQFKEADALLGKAYLRSADVELLKDRARVREAMGDSAGCCVDDCTPTPPDGSIHAMAACVSR